ncbi:MAG: plasmid mobilization protein [Candidatus Limivicinus sp.]
MRKRSHHVSVWMNEAEYKHLKAQAQIAGMGVDPFIRNLVAGVQLRPRPPDEYTALLRELAAIGNNINQIAHWANAQKSVHEAQIVEAAVLAHEAWRLVKDKL